MKLRKWSSEEKMAIVLEGLKGEKSIAEICREHQISQTLYYRWRDRFLEAGQKGLSNGGGEDEKASQAQIEELEKIIGRQTIAIDNPRGNAETERVIRTIKEELLWLNEFGSFEEAEARIGAWIEEDYNRLYVHSALGYLSLEEFAQQWAQTQEATSQGAQI